LGGGSWGKEGGEKREKNKKIQDNMIKCGKKRRGGKVQCPIAIIYKGGGKEGKKKGEETLYHAN